MLGGLPALVENGPDNVSDKVDRDPSLQVG
jgi:hypothetical protein